MSRFSRYVRSAPFLLLYATWLTLALNPRDAESAVSDCLESNTAIPLPTESATKGAFFGSVSGRLILAGGETASAGSKGGLEVSDRVQVFAQDGSAPSDGPKLLVPRAYGCSVGVDDGIVCIGGRDAYQAFADVSLIHIENGRLIRSELPKMPAPLTGACAARIGNRIFVAGGHGVANGVSSATSQTFLMLDLNDLQAGWQSCEQWPGPARAYAVAAVQAGSFYLIGGARAVDPRGAPIASELLHDVYQFVPNLTGNRGTWTCVARVPFDAAGAASPGVSFGQSHVAVVPASKTNADSPHTGLSRVWWYHTITDTWTEGAQSPAAEFAAASTPWETGFAVISPGQNTQGSGGQITVFAPKPRTAALTLLDYFVIGGYFSLLPLIGWYCSRRTEGTDDFFLGGRRIPWWAAGISIYSTMLSGITYMGIPALSYSGNWTRLVAGFSPVLVAPIIVRYYVPFFCRLQVTSAYEYLELRFNLAARLIATSLFLLFQLGRVAIVVSLPALALSAVTGMSMTSCILLTGAVATLYTYLGGIEAVIWVDVLQVGVLIGGAVLTLLCVVHHLDGGWSTVLQTGSADHKFQLLNLNMDYTQTVMWVILVGGFFESLYSYSSDQTIIQRYLTTKDQASAAQSLWTNAALSFPCLILFFMLGSALYAYYKIHPEQANPLLPTDAVFPLFVSGHLPAGLVGLVIAGIFAASMDNLPSSVTCMSTAIVTDFFLRFWPNSSDQTRLRLARFLTVILGVSGTCVALLMTQFDIKSQVDQYAKTIGLFAGGVAGIFALGIFTTRANGIGGLAGLLGSAVVQYIVARYTSLNFLLYSVTGSVSCFVIGYIVSLLFRVPQKPLDGLTVHTLRHAVENQKPLNGWAIVPGNN